MSIDATPASDKTPEKKKLMCPKCQTKLFEHGLSNSEVKVENCPSCRGMWFDHGELAAKLGLTDTEIMATGDASITGRMCPVCDIVMSSFTYPNTDVDVDLCEECGGVWLDAGELKRLETELKEGGPKKGFFGSLLNSLGIG